MSWTTARDDLRGLLSDGPTDKNRYLKAVMDAPNGTRTSFRTFENRRLTNFTDSGIAPLGVYVNGAPVTVASDNPSFGVFTLSAAPAVNDSIEASYYVQWFTDSEIDQFLATTVRWLGFTNSLSIPDGLRAATLDYAASKAYQKLSVQWAQNYSDTYKMQDQDPEHSPVNPYAKLSADFAKSATTARNEYYTRQGRAKQPLFGAALGNVVDVVPRR